MQTNAPTALLEDGSKDNQSEFSSKDPWLSKAEEAYNSSTSFTDANYRTKWENNIRHQNSLHHIGSKYNSEGYKYRSKIFRPKTRAMTRSNEAACVAAFFSNQDHLSIEPVGVEDPIKKASAEICQEVLQYRLDVVIPWFQTVIGAFQDAQVIGVVVSRQEWVYDELIKKYEVQYIDDATGEISSEVEEEVIVIKDTPAVTIIPIENCRFHPSAKWYDPVNTSPYWIELVPMYVGDVKDRMSRDNNKTGEKRWKYLTDGQIVAAMKQTYDSTRRQRNPNMEDNLDVPKHTKLLTDFDVVWVHRNYIRHEKEDFFYYTLGTQEILSDPVPLSDISPDPMNPERPYVWGCAVIETHKTIPESIVGIGAPIQKELNQNASLRSDNVQLVLNKRYIVKRGSQVNVKSLTRNVPGSVTMANDPKNDINIMEFNDVTSSSYQEQDRLNADFDEVTGAFSTSSVNTNRKLNETVGGMNMLRSGANTLTEYVLKTFAETWVEKVLRQLVTLIQRYETDEVILGLAAEKANLWQKYGIDEITDRLLSQKLTTKVNVGMGATDPVMKLHNLVFGIDIIIKVYSFKAEQPQSKLNVMEIAKEVFGRLGYKDGTRFLEEQLVANGVDPEKAQMGQVIQELESMIAELQSALEDKTGERQAKLTLGKMKEDGQNKRKTAELQTRLLEKQLDLANPVSGEQLRKNGNGGNGGGGVNTNAYAR